MSGSTSQSIKRWFCYTDQWGKIIAFKKKLELKNIYKNIWKMEKYGNLCDKLNEFSWDMKFSFVSRDRALFVTENDEVYQFKRKSDNMYWMVRESELFTDMKNSIIALSEDKTTFKLTLEKSKVKELCDKKILRI